MKEITINVTDEQIKALTLLGFVKEEPDYYVNQPLLVRARDSDVWKSRFFSHFSNDNTHCFLNGGTSYNQSDTTWWKQAKPDPDAPTLFNWITNTGEAPDCERVLARFENGNFFDRTYVRDIDFSLNGNRDIKDYIILK